MKLCECGCGLPAPLAHQSDTKRGYVKGQPMRFLKGHSNSHKAIKGLYRQVTRHEHPKAKNGCIYEHVAIAEAALGKYLPDGAEVHHVNGDSRDNRPSNLVICQDKAYHKLLHQRARVIAAGANPNIEKVCSRCRAVKPLNDFGRRSASVGDGKQSACRSCMATGYRSDWRSQAVAS